MGFWATFSHRVRCLRKRGPLWCKLLLPLDLYLGMCTTVFAHCEIPSGTRIGPGLFMPHPDGVILSDKCKIGAEAIIFQQVTVGCWKNQSPQIRSRACLFSGAKVIGGIVIGRGAAVGANGVATKDVPAKHVAVGIPAVSRPMYDEQAEAAARAEVSVARWRQETQGEMPAEEGAMVFRLHNVEKQNRMLP